MIELTVDDARDEILQDEQGFIERKITRISPKKELPNLGAPEIIEQKYSDGDGKNHFLIKKTVNQFDQQGNIISQALYDANGNYCYSIMKDYERGLLIREIDLLGHETRYFYDANRNLLAEIQPYADISKEYAYDLRNCLVRTIEKRSRDHRIETHTTYDSVANILSEIDPFGNQTTYLYDSLGRVIQTTYPETSDGAGALVKPIYTYSYDIFDHPISETDPKGRTLTKSYTVHGKPIEINYPDGTNEKFKYDTGGNLYQYYGKDGILQRFEYDYKGRVANHSFFERRSDGSEPFEEKTYSYNAFHKIAQFDELYQSKYTYNRAGQLLTLEKENQKVEFLYDSLGRTQGVKKWKTPKTFTLELKEYDPLNRVAEERIEDQSGKLLFKKRYTYNKTGQLAQIIGYPQNKESVLTSYEYDAIGRVCKTTLATGRVITITYDDAAINKWGQKTQKRTLIDGVGNQREETFNMDGQLIKIVKKNRSGQILSESETSYDILGNKILERALIVSTNEPPKSFEIAQSYNQKDLLEVLTLSREKPEEHTIKYKYNSFGDIAARYNPSSKDPITYRYDTEANMDMISFKSEDREEGYELSYDQYKNLTQIKGDSFRVNYHYAPNHLPLSEIVNDAFGSYAVTQTYDGEGKVELLRLPDGSFVEYIYEGPFVKEIKRLTKDKKELYTHQIIARDLMGNVLEEVLPRSLKNRKQQWDKAGRRVEISTDFLEDKVQEEGYDPLGQIQKRETILDDQQTATGYNYNHLGQLIDEIEHRYVYDSIGNRLEKDGTAYKVNHLNQVIEAEGANYTYDVNGTLATKTEGKKSWSYQSNPLNQIVSITNPEQTRVKFTYDPSGRRLTKQVEVEGKKTKIFRYFYLGNTEIGCVDEKGIVTELKVPSNPNDPETESIAIEIGNTMYVPLYDLQRNIACLLDPKKQRVVESYHYSAFGEEQIFNAERKRISESSVGNSWRYRGKRIDKETSLIYFGYRYYDPQLGRWVSPDPLGAIDGPNLYTYVHNNPLSYVDYFGLNSIDESCGCIKHDHPGWHNAPEKCVCICGKTEFAKDSYTGKVGSNIQNAINGMSHGVVDFAIQNMHSLQTAAVYSGSEELDLNYQERTQMVGAIEQSQVNRMSAVEGWVMDLLSIDELDAVYQSFRSKTTMGLEIGSLVAGGYGVVKGVIGFSKLARMPVKMAKIGARGMHGMENALKIGNFRYANTAGNHVTDIIKRGAFKGELSRPYMKSPLTVNEIMAAGKPIPDPRGIPGGLRWDIPGTFRGSEGTWELVIHPETEIIYHFNFK